ncbi:G1 family glutamic endopeptidase [Nocardia sp. NPDC050406]|uniref:G1 family glutamic endopeptidase n=1 Tax=Nocardia sp. NPDC050406 TaxID=3364318 RepID=UPI0037AC7979
MKLPTGKSALARCCATAVLALSAASALTVAEAAADDRVRAGNWAGYVVQGDFHRVSATWVHPTITCTNPGVVQRLVPWVGLNGTQDASGAMALPLMQTGVESLCVSEAAIYAAQPGLRLGAAAADLTFTNPVLSDVLMGASSRVNNALGGAADGLCATGALPALCATEWGTDAWWEAYPQPPYFYDDVTTDPGDTMRSTVEFDGARYTMTLENRTKNWTRATTVESTAPARTAEIVVEGQLDSALPGFSPITFTDIEIDGKSLSAYETEAIGIPATNRVLIPGPVRGASFTIG